MRPVWIAVLIVGSILVTLTINLPARWLVPTEVEQVRMSPAKGDIWSGVIDSLQYQKLHVRHLQWSIAASDLLDAHLSIPVSAQIDDGRVSGMLNVGLGTMPTATDVDIDLNVSSLVALLPDNLLGTVKISGRVQGTAQKIVLDYNNPKKIQVDADLTWKAISATLSPLSISLGDIGMTIRAVEAGGNKVQLSNSASSPWHIQATADIDEQGNYNIQLQLRPPKNLNDNMASILKFSGGRLQNGQYHYNLQGSL